MNADELTNRIDALSKERDAYIENANSQIAFLNGKVSELSKERDEFVGDANRQIAFFNGKIEMLAELLGRAREISTQSNGHIEQIETTQ